jgi:hypothetical protein
MQRLVCLLTYVGCFGALAGNRKPILVIVAISICFPRPGFWLG